MFDFLGTFERRQWEDPTDGLHAFVLAAVRDANARLNYLQLEIGRAEKYVAKLVAADDALGGTSKRGNTASLYPSDAVEKRELSDPKRQVPLLKFLATTRAKPAISGVSFGKEATLGGGDHIWLDLPVRNELVEPGRVFSDQVTGALVEQAKSNLTEVIRRRRENLEFKLKKALDYREQLLREFFELTRKKIETDSNLKEAEQSTELAEGATLSPQAQKAVGEQAGQSVNQVADAIALLIDRVQVRISATRRKVGLDPGTEDIPRKDRDGLIKESAGIEEAGIGQKAGTGVVQNKTTVGSQGLGSKGEVPESGLEDQLENSDFVIKVEDTGGIVSSASPTRGFPLEQTEQEMRDRFEFKFETKAGKQGT